MPQIVYVVETGDVEWEDFRRDSDTLVGHFDSVFGLSTAHTAYYEITPYVITEEPSCLN